MSSPDTGASASAASFVMADSPLSASAIGALRCALQAQLRLDAPGAVAEKGLREALRVLCADARHHTVRAEQLLIALKQTWVAVPEVQELAPDARRVLLDRLVTLAIQAYYASPVEQPQ